MESHALLRINAQEEDFLPVEVKVDWLSRQASMRSRASAMVGRRISQLDDAIRVRALFAIIRATTASPPTAPTATATATVSPPAAGGVGAAAAAAADTAPDAADIAPDAASTQDEQPVGKEETTAPSQGAPATDAVRRPPEEGLGEVLMRLVRTGSTRNCCTVATAAADPPRSQELEVFLRMAVSRMKDVLFQLASDEEKKERGNKCLFDVYEGLLTSETLYNDAKEGFPSLDVDTVMLPKHFRYRSLIAARHRFLLRKLGVLLDMEDSVEGLLDRAADAEALRDSLADVDLSAPEDDDDDDWEEEDDEQEARDRDSSAVSALVSPRAGSAPQVVKAMPILRNTSWDKDAVGNDDTTEGETDEETMTTEEISPSH